MSSFFAETGLATGDISLRCIGGVAPTVVNAIYPMEALTTWHAANHIPGLTGRWMDTGSTALGGAVRGSFHRLAHGHHFFEDGFKVLVNSDLKYGQFLHHLGLDSLTARGIPNPLFPTAVGQNLVNMGMSQHFVSEMMTVNVPKVLGGSLGLVCAGTDVFACFSNAIPHTFMAAGMHFGFGTLDILFGMYPPNVLLLSAGASELGVGAVTTYRAIIDPVIPALHVPASVFLPALGQAIALTTMVGACVSVFTGTGWSEVPKTMLESAAASTVSTTVTFMAAGSGFLAPFLGPLAGITTFLLLKKPVDSLHPQLQLPPIYREYGTSDALRVFSLEQAIPLFGIPREPIGMLKGDLLLLNERSLSIQGEFWTTK